MRILLRRLRRNLTQRGDVVQNKEPAPMCTRNQIVILDLEIAAPSSQAC